MRPSFIAIPAPTATNVFEIEYVSNLGFAENLVHSSMIAPSFLICAAKRYRSFFSAFL
jgi:hypothetical protein